MEELVETNGGPQILVSPGAKSGGPENWFR